MPKKKAKTVRNKFALREHAGILPSMKAKTNFPTISELISHQIMHDNPAAAAEFYWKYMEEISNAGPVSISTNKSSLKSSKKLGIEELGLSDCEEVKDFKKLVSEMEIISDNGKTFVYVIAVNKKNPESNVVRNIQSNSGEPFGGYVYDAEYDQYYVECVEFLKLGYVSKSFVLTMPNVGNWKIPIPLPVPVIKSCLNKQQDRVLRDFEDKFTSDIYELQFVQMRGDVA